MWSIVLVSLLLGLEVVFGENSATESKTNGIERLAPASNSTSESNMKQAEDRFLDEMWAFAGADFGDESSRTGTTSAPYGKGLLEGGRGRKLKYKKAGLQFLIKTLLTLKLVLGIILPLGIIAAKVLSWKAVTLSMMAFMLAKILLVKNLLSGKSIFSATPTNFIPPVLIQSAPNEAYWKRQGDLQASYPWNSA